MSGVHSEVFGELQRLGAACLVGAGMTAVYDVFRIFRRMIRHGILWVSLEDCLYWICFAVVEFVLLYRENNGVLRGYLFGGTVVGAVCYHFLISRPLMKFFSKIIKKIKKVLQKIRKSVMIVKGHRP